MVLQHESCADQPSEALSWDILESVTDAVVTIDEEHKIVVCNRAAEKMFGYPCSEILGKDVSPLIPSAYQPEHWGYVKRYLDSGVPRVLGKSRECLGQRKDGTTFPVEIAYSVSKTGTHLYFTAVIRDISERQALEREMRFIERLADVGKAVAHVVHEIRKPLMLIGGFARQVARSEALRSDTKHRRKLNIIVEEVQRLETLLNGIRLLTRPSSSSHKQRVLLNDLLEETFELIQPMLQRRHIRLERELSREPLQIHGDADQLKQVLLNVLHNAAEAMERGSIHVSSAASEGMARIRIVDDGPGIEKETQEKLFDPFFTTKANGTGLGLAISENIARDHGGSIALYSEPPHGTTVVLELPLQPATA